jgi:hypothetical protein
MFQVQQRSPPLDNLKLYETWNSSIDTFIESKLKENGLTMSPEPDPIVLAAPRHL